MNEKIRLSTDNHYVKTSHHNTIKKVLIDSGYGIEEERSDTRAMGGPAWFPRDFIISISAAIFDGLLSEIGKKGLEIIIKTFKKMKEREKELKINMHVNIELEQSADVYFVLDSQDYFSNVSYNDEEHLEKAFSSIPRKIKEIESLFAKDETKVLGNPHTIILKYDFSDNNWVITDLLSPTSQDFEI